MRESIELAGLDGLAEFEIVEPVRFVFESPRRGGPALSFVRAALKRWRVRFSGTQNRLFADVDPLPAEPRVLALDTIARSDADGLERLILSMLPHVDEIVLGVDARSDEETWKVAQAFADEAVKFSAADIGLTDDDWAANKIHFANARNIGRRLVKSPWCLVADSDEYLASAPTDLRERLALPEHTQACETRLHIGDMEYDDHQRLARTFLRWKSATHNQLLHTGLDMPIDLHIVEDKALRDVVREAERNAQRDVGIEALIEEAAAGNLSALFHLAKHRTSQENVDVAAKLVEDYRLRIEPHSELADERAWLALAVGFRYYREGNLPEADRWGVRALLDGPRVLAFCLLGDVAEDQGDLKRARGWYECACATEDESKIAWPGVTEIRWGRLAGIRMALAGVPVVEEEADDTAS